MANAAAHAALLLSHPSLETLAFSAVTSLLEVMGEWRSRNGLVLGPVAFPFTLVPEIAARASLVGWKTKGKVSTIPLLPLFMALDKSSVRSAWHLRAVEAALRVYDSVAYVAGLYHAAQLLFHGEELSRVPLLKAMTKATLEHVVDPIMVDTGHLLVVERKGGTLRLSSIPL